MTVLKASQFKAFSKSFPEMTSFYPQLNSAADREFMSETFFGPADEYDYEPEDLNDYEYQQSLY